MTLEVTPDNCFLVDKSLPPRSIAFAFMDWLHGRTPLTGRPFNASDSYRVALMHPELERWFWIGDQDATDFGYRNTIGELHQVIPMVRDHTLPEDIIQVLEHITIKEIE